MNPAITSDHQSRAADQDRSQQLEAYELFRLEKQGALRSASTLNFYDLHIGKFLRWLAKSSATARFEHLDANLLRRFRAHVASSLTPAGRPLQPESVHASHRALRAFLFWAQAEGYPIDMRLLRLPAPTLPSKGDDGVSHRPDPPIAGCVRGPHPRRCRSHLGR